MWLYNFLLGLDLRAILVFTFLFLLIADFLKHRSPPNYPPGPLALPFMGNLFSMNSQDQHKYLTKLADVYGNVFNIRLGGEKMVCLSGYKTVKEALITQAENFADRPLDAFSDKLYGGTTNGIFMSNAEPWKQHRRFVLSTFRNFGFGKNLMEQKICEEVRHLQEEIDNEKGRLFNPADVFSNSVSNIICQLVMGRRFDYNDHRFKVMLKCVSDGMKSEGSTLAELYRAFPWLMKYLPGIHHKLFSHYNNILDFFGEVIESHKQDLDPNNPRDYIDTFLLEMQRDNKTAVSFTEDNLAKCSLDLFLAGTETTSTTLRWALVLLIKNPHVQEKVQEEIDQVIGQNRLPTMADRLKMPYTDAVIHEIQRFGNIVPLNGARVATKDTTLGGYFIPKGTTLMPFLTSVLFDKTEWATPEVFNPGHFLDANGKFVKREAFLPFSAGKRVCLGESLAKMELFLFFVGLFQKYSFSVPDREALSSKGVSGITLSPMPFKVYAKVR